MAINLSENKLNELKSEYTNEINKLEQLSGRVDYFTSLVEERLKTFIEKNKTLPAIPDIIDALTNLYKTNKDIHESIIHAIRDFVTKISDEGKGDNDEFDFSKVISLLESRSTEVENANEN